MTIPVGTQSRWPTFVLRMFNTDITKGRAIELDAIRGLAIILAMGWHLNHFTESPAFDALLAPGRLFGWVGVDIFFVLSGFLIGGLILKEIEATNTFNTGRFLIRRAFRLWPMLYLYMILQLVAGRFPAIEFVPQILLHVQNFFITPFSHLWSLAVEEQFYFLAALCLPLLARIGLSDRKLIIGLVAVAILATTLRTVGWFNGVDDTQLQWQTQYRADVLCVGILLAVLKMRRPAVYASLQAHRWIAGVLAVVSCAGLTWTYYEPNLQALIGFPCGTLLGASLLVGLDGIKMGRYAQAITRPLAFMGLYSYTMYIFHNSVGRLSYQALMPHVGPVLAMIGCYVVVIVFSIVLTRLVERPMIELRDMLFPTKQLHGKSASTREQLAPEGEEPEVEAKTA